MESMTCRLAFLAILGLLSACSKPTASVPSTAPIQADQDPWERTGKDIAKK